MIADQQNQGHTLVCVGGEKAAIANQHDDSCPVVVGLGRLGAAWGYNWRR
jgi:hypothetical protein